MNSGKRILIFVLVVVVLGGVVAVSLTQQGRDRTTVQTAVAATQNLSSVVTASGEITPKTYADISPNNIGQITDLYVKEGDHVKQGQLLAKLWNVQEAAAVDGMKAAIKTADANLAAQVAALGTAQADVDRDTAQLAQAAPQWKRNQALYEDQLLAKADYETDEATYKTAVEQLKVSQASLVQAKAQVASLEAQVNQAKANLASASDALSRTEFTSPLSGIVTYLPVHVGDTVVMGIQNSPGSVIMRVADMSVVTAWVQVDETDIASVHLGQPATVTIDAYGDQKFAAHVTQVGDNALLRSTGAAASSNGSDAQQAKDFQVVVTLDAPPQDMRPGLSCTAQITTATADNALTVPLQAVVERDPSQLKAVDPNAPPVLTPAKAQVEQPEQGIFVIDPKDQTAVFVKATTGITGVDHVQVLSGLKAGDQVVTGPYSALRSLANHARIKVDNSVAAIAAATSSSN